MPKLWLFSVHGLGPRFRASLLQGSACGRLAILQGCLFLCMAAAANGLSAEELAHADRIALGHAENFSNGLVAVRGEVRPEVLQTEMGGYQERYEVATVQGRGSSITFEVKAPPVGQRLLLEFQEVHNRRLGAFGYTVRVNDQPVYFRTYEELGAGPNHFFVQVPRSLTDGPKAVQVELRSEGSVPFSLAQVWAYHDFEAGAAAREGIYRPMGLLGFKIGKESPAAKFQSFSPVGTLAIAQYGSEDLDKGRQNLRKHLEDAGNSEAIVAWMVNGTSWGGKPSGPDGRGGYFSDPAYSNLRYDPEHGRYGASWPNMWGNSQWPTLQNAWMNTYLERRFAKLMRGLQEDRDAQILRGEHPELLFVREWAPPIGEISGGGIARARAAGVVLDPADGLSREERLWMFREGLRVWRDFAESTRSAIPEESVLVDRGRVERPTRRLRDQLYSQPDFLTDWPMEDKRWNGGQHGMVPGLWSSGEMGQGHHFSEIAMYDYVRARGRLAMVNMERTILKEDFRVLRDHFARGFQLVILFNDNAGDSRFVRAVDGCEDAVAPPAPHCNPAILGWDFARAKSLPPAESIAASENIQCAHDKAFSVTEHRVPRLAVVDRTRAGSLLLKLGLNGDPLPDSLTLALNGRISSMPGNRIEIRAGASRERLEAVAMLTAKELPCPSHWTMHMTSAARVSLGSALAGQTSGFLELNLNSPSAEDAAFLLSFSVESAWPRQSGYLVPEAPTSREQRTRELWVQERALAAHLLEEYRERARASAPDGIGQLPAHEAEVYRRGRDLHERGWYRTASRLLVSDIAEILPARYVVRGHGQLGRHPVQVALADAEATAAITLHRVGPGGCVFSATALETPGLLRLAFPRLDPSVPWRIRSPSDGSWVVEEADDPDPDAGQPLRLVDGHPIAEIHAERPAAETGNVIPGRITGRLLAMDAQTITFDTQDLAVMNDGHSLTLPLAADHRIELRADHLSDPTTNPRPKPFDRVDLMVDSSGNVQNILATYGRDRGKIRKFHAPHLIGEPTPGGIELDNGRRYDLAFGLQGTTFDTVALRTRSDNYEIGMLEEALKPGTEVELEYSPSPSLDSRPRLTRVTQKSDILLDVDFTETKGNDWKKHFTSVAGVDVVDHRPEPNYLYEVVMRLLRPTAFFEAGELVCQISQEQPFATTVVEFTARAFEDSSAVEFFVSTNGGATWTKVGRFDNTWQNNIPQSTNSRVWKFPPQFVDLTAAVSGHRTFLLKARLTVGDADERFCMGALRVLTAAQPKQP